MFQFERKWCLWSIPFLQHPQALFSHKIQIIQEELIFIFEYFLEDWCIKNRIFRSPNSVRKDINRLSTKQITFLIQKTIKHIFSEFLAGKKLLYSYMVISIQCYITYWKCKVIDWLHSEKFWKQKLFYVFWCQLFDWDIFFNRAAVLMHESDDYVHRFTKTISHSSKSSRI